MERRGGMHPKEPSSSQELVINGYWATTGGVDKEPFLVDDNGRDVTPESGTDESLRHLAQSSVWFMDVNFSMAPRIFS